MQKMVRTGKWKNGKMERISTLTFIITPNTASKLNIHTKCFLYLHQMFTLLLYTPNYVQYPH